jgi:trk system potassium uptake protein TrkH
VNDFRSVTAALGILIVVLGTMMMVPAIIDLAYRNDDWIVFAVSATVTIFAGCMLWLTGRQAEAARLTVRQAFLLTSMAWIVLAGFGGLPFMWSQLGLSFTRAYFETISGLTTTGSTVLTGLDSMPPGILLWRSLLQWYGGIGIIVVAISILPMLRVGGMQLFRTESSDKSEKVLPRVTEIANRIMTVYVLLSLACAFAYFAAGMTAFDAVNHAMTTLATGGFSTHDSSLGEFNSKAVDYIAILFMTAGALPMILYVRAMAGDLTALLRSSEVRLFLAVIAIFTLASVVQQRLADINTGETAFRYALFNVVTQITTTGFATTDYAVWGAASDAIFFFVMFLGGCTGSTAGGLKIFRLAILGTTVVQHLKRIIYPHGVFPIRYGGKPVGDDVVAAVMSFLFLYLLTFAAVALLLNSMGLDFKTAFSATIACLASVGPGLGSIVGPAGNFSTLDDAALWLLAFAMLVGRLELFTVYVLLLPRFWRP